MSDVIHNHVLQELVDFIASEFRQNVVDPKLVNADIPRHCYMCNWSPDHSTKTPADQLIGVEMGPPTPESVGLRYWFFCRDRAACQLKTAFL